MLRLCAIWVLGGRSLSLHFLSYEMGALQASSLGFEVLPAVNYSPSELEDLCVEDCPMYCRSPGVPVPWPLIWQPSVCTLSMCLKCCRITHQLKIEIKHCINLGPPGK